MVKNITLNKNYRLEINDGILNIILYTFAFQNFNINFLDKLNSKEGKALFIYAVKHRC